MEHIAILERQVQDMQQFSRTALGNQLMKTYHHGNLYTQTRQ